MLFIYGSWFKGSSSRDFNTSHYHKETGYAVSWSHAYPTSLTKLKCWRIFWKRKKKVKASIEKKTWEYIFAIAFWTVFHWKEYSVTEINFQIPITNQKKFNESICLNGMSAILRKSPFHTIEIFSAYFYNGGCESIVIIQKQIWTI